VHHLAHQQAIGLDGLALLAEGGPEGRVDLVRHVQPPPVDADLRQVELRNVKHVPLHLQEGNHGTLAIIYGMLAIIQGTLTIIILFYFM
jgi:hypothetical protein